MHRILQRAPSSLVLGVDLCPVSDEHDPDLLRGQVSGTATRDEESVGKGGNQGLEKKKGKIEV